MLQRQPDLYLRLDIIDSIAAFDLQCNSLASQCFHKYLHYSAIACYDYLSNQPSSGRVSS